MTALFLVLGYLGVPVAFALIAGVLVGTLFTPISLPSIIGQLFNGIDSEALMAMPFFLLVGELMTSANVVIRIANLSQALVGHMRGGLAQVVDRVQHVLLGHVGLVLGRRRGADAAPWRSRWRRRATAGVRRRADRRRLDHRRLVPPSIMAVVYGAIGNVSIAGLFLGGIVPGVMIGIGLMIYCYFFGPVGFRRPRATLPQLGAAAQRAALPLMIPVILLGGILTGWFTPTEAGVVADRLYPARRASRCSTRASAQLAARLRAGRADLLAAADHHRRGLRVRLDAGLSARADRRLRLDRRDSPATTRSRSCSCWCCVHHRRRFHRADPGDHHLHAGRQPADRGGRHQHRAHGRRADRHAGLRADHAALWPGAADGVEIRRRAVLARRCARRCRSTSIFFATIAFTIFVPDVILWLPKHVFPESVGCFKAPAGGGYICP